MSTLCLQERLYEALAQPVNSVDDLKKLAAVCKQIDDMRIAEDPTVDDMFKDQLANLQKHVRKS